MLLSGAMATIQSSKAVGDGVISAKECFSRFLQARAARVVFALRTAKLMMAARAARMECCGAKHRDLHHRAAYEDRQRGPSSLFSRNLSQRKEH
jgi:hypothetical protein